jgi:hypothetical protein
MLTQFNGPSLVYKKNHCTYTQAMSMHYFDYYVIQKWKMR